MKQVTRASARLATAAVVVAAAVVLRAQAPSALDQELRRIFQSNEYTAETFWPAVWFDDGSYAAHPAA